MKILALEFSSSQRSVAVFDSAQSGVVSAVSEFGGRSTRAFGLIEQALVKANLVREQIDCLAIGIGPGSYTGIRAAISIAQGWQIARDIKIVGVCSAEAIAAAAQVQGLNGKNNIVIDAQRNEFYLAAYDVTASSLSEVEGLHIVGVGEVQRRIDAGEVVIGPDIQSVFPKSQLIYPEASIVASLAGQGRESIPGDKLEPIYLRETTFVKGPPARIIS